MLELAFRNSPNPVGLKDIAKSQAMSERYLERIMGNLVSAGLVHSLRGQHGGFVLARPADDIRISQIVTAVEGPLAPVACVTNPQTCTRSKHCAARDVWIKLKESIASALDGFTLEDLARLHAEKQIPSDNEMYYI